MARSEKLSPPASRKQLAEKRERRRETVIRAALELFNRRGFSAVSVDDIASRLGIAKPTVYHYIGNKEQVLFECMRRALDELHDAVNTKNQSLTG